jgi:tRNA pseudouridine38-40 synthase
VEYPFEIERLSDSEKTGGGTMNYKLTISYDGSRYKGWQRLNDESTVQGKIEQVLSELAGHRIEINGCSRTDAGVHASGQIANFKMNTNMHPQEVKLYLNRYLPLDISVSRVEEASDSFHARLHAKQKIYLYQIWNEAYGNPFLRRYSLHVEKKLDIGAMQEAAKFFVGVHDFTAFSNARTKAKSKTREIFSIGIETDGSLLKIRICGDGFVHNMVRRIAGILIEVGLSQIKPGAVAQMLQSGQRSDVGVTAEACGLILESVEY